MTSNQIAPQASDPSLRFRTSGQTFIRAQSLPPSTPSSSCTARTQRGGHFLRRFCTLLRVMLLRAKCCRLLDWRSASSPCVSAGSAGRLARGKLVVRRSLDRARRRPMVSFFILKKSQDLKSGLAEVCGMRSSG